MFIKENNINLSDFDMYINGTKEQAIITGRHMINYYNFYSVVYKFPNFGKYEVKIVFNKTLTTMNRLFEECYNLISIDFLETFDTSHVLDMTHMFSNCVNLAQVNVSSFNTSLVGYMWNMFYGCKSLISLDLSNFNTRNTFSMQTMFCSSSKLSYIDISSFETSYLYSPGPMLDNIALNGTIIISNKASRIKNYIPKGWIIKNKE